MTARPRVVLTGVLVVLCCLANAGCGPSDQGADPDKQLAFQQLVEREIAEASAHGASQHQLAILLQAQEDGVLSPEAMRQAIVAYGDCALAAGLGFEMLDSTGSQEFPDHEYLTMTTLGGDVALMEACNVKELSFVSSVYQLQPAYQKVREDRLMSKSAELVACLRDEGRDIDDDPTLDELRRELIFGQIGHYPGEPPPVDPGPFYDCLGPVGLQGSDVNY